MSTKALSYLLPAQLLKLILSMALQIVIARLLLPEGRGVYALCIAVSTGFTLVTHLGNEFGIRYLLLNKRINLREAIQYLLLIASFSWLTSLGMVYFAWSFDHLLSVRISSFQLALACTFSFTQLIITQFNVFMTIKEQYLSASILAVMEEAVKLCLLAVILIQSNSVEVVLISLTFGNIIIGAYMLNRFRLLDKARGLFNLNDIRFIYSYGLRSFWLNFSNLSNGHMGTLVLAGLMTNSQIGIYNLAFGLVAKIQVIPDALNRVFVPASIQAKDPQRQISMMKLSITGLLIFSLTITPVLGIFNRRIIESLFGPEYTDAGPIAFLIFVGFALKIIVKPIEAYFNEVIGRPNVIALNQIFGVIMMAVFTYFGGTMFGLPGAALGSSVALIFSSLILLFTYLRCVRLNISGLFDFQGLIARLIRGRD